VAPEEPLKLLSQVSQCAFLPCRLEDEWDDLREVESVQTVVDEAYVLCREFVRGDCEEQTDAVEIGETLALLPCLSEGFDDLET